MLLVSSNTETHRENAIQRWGTFEPRNAKGLQEPAEAGRDRKDSSLGLQREHGLDCILIQISGLQNYGRINFC
jgi:hypothetical protein